MITAESYHLQKSGVKAMVVTVLIQLFISTGIYGQSSEVRFFSSRSLQKEVSPQRARFSLTVEEQNGFTTTEVKDLRKQQVVQRETYRGQEPYGVWLYEKGEGFITLDYNFELVYSEKQGGEANRQVWSWFFEDRDSIGYKAPRIATGEKNLGQFIIRNLYYPQRAREQGLSGKVHVGFVVSREGSIENIIINKSAHILLDKEAVRVMRQLRLLNPATIKGEPQEYLLNQPINYRIQ